MGWIDHAVRLPYFRGAWERFPYGSIDTKVRFGVYARPHYAYGVYWAAILAKRLSIPRITAIEFGVAGGRGLLALEELGMAIGRHVGVEIDVVGFDSGEGMPQPTDYRDLPHVWNAGFFKMNAPRLQAVLKSATLVLGEVAQTSHEWLEGSITSPIGFIAFDLDYYSSTRDAFTIFEGNESTHLPRVQCYFDDLACTEVGCMNEYVGEYLAISEFNAGHSSKKICRQEQFRLNRFTWENWHDRMYAFHDFAHPEYTRLVSPQGDANTQMPL